MGLRRLRMVNPSDTVPKEDRFYRRSAPVDEHTKKGNRCCFKTHLPLMPHICVNGQEQHWFCQLRVACSARSHYLNQSWLIVNRNPRNNFSDVLTKISTFSCKKLYLEMSSAKWRPFYPGRNQLTLLFLQFYEKNLLQQQKQNLKSHHKIQP